MSLAVPQAVNGQVHRPLGWWCGDVDHLDMLKPTGIRSLGLVGCSKRKRRTALPLPPVELYAGVLFRYAYRYSTAHHDLTLILSGRWGLVPPQALLEPYDYLLPQRQLLAQAWASHVLAQLDPLWRDPATSLNDVYLYAGQRYSQPLLDLVAQQQRYAGVTWHWPVRGLALQQQVRWFREHQSDPVDPPVLRWTSVTQACPRAARCLPRAPHIILCGIYCGGTGMRRVARLAAGDPASSS
ncbi:MAG: hypothetical protein KKA73_22265 [Chloroflexi bacterium]|nr:hypothetical protein [Chloroflexota bacterium]MBU1750418.1 hypothetical protein [Chloroflexota bacterium]